MGALAVALALAGCGDDDGPAVAPTSTPVATATGSPTRTATAVDTVPQAATITAAVSRTATATIPPTAASTASPTISFTPTLPPTPAPPQIAVFGVTRADDLVQDADGVDAAGRPIFMRPQGQAMMLFIEARRGSARLDEVAYDPAGALPGVEVLVSRPLGDGSLAVCDYDPPLIGGVPGVDPPTFTDDQTVRDAVADLGCRFNDGTGVPRGRNANNACTRDAGALYSFVDPTAELQYCLPIAKDWAFPPGDTVVAARVRDRAGRVSAARELVIRVAGEEPFDCASGLGERLFSPQTPASRLVVDGQGVVSLDDWIAEPLRICAGPDLGAGVHALTLREDARVGIPLVDGSTLCARFRARGSDGVLDCGDGTPQDVRAIADRDSGRITVDTGLGVPAGTGAASLRVAVAFLVLPGGSVPSDCVDARFGAEISDALTTATATAEVLDAGGMPVASLVWQGEPFTCSSWRDGGSPVLVLPIPAAGSPAGDLAAALVLAD